MPEKDDARSARRTALAESLADIALHDGIDALSLRPAAARLGTSDRMLLYYFGTKARLLAQTLDVVSARLAVRLEAVPAAGSLPPFRLIALAAGLLADGEVRPAAVLWAEIVARAARGDEACRGAAERVIAGWIEWIVARTAFPPGIDPATGAAAMLAVIEGMSALAVVRAERVDPGTSVAALQALAGSTAAT